jgi:hypothetical protein
MAQDLRNKIKEIIGETQCPHELCCLETGFDKVCKTREVGLEQYIECLEEDASHCSFSASYGNSQYCSCPLRVYICKKLKK